MVSFADQQPLTMVAKSFPAHLVEGSKAYAIAGYVKSYNCLTVNCEKVEAVLILKQSEVAVMRLGVGRVSAVYKVKKASFSS